MGYTFELVPSFRSIDFLETENNSHVATVWFPNPTFHIDISDDPYQLINRFTRECLGMLMTKLYHLGARRTALNSPNATYLTRKQFVACNCVQSTKQL